MPAARRRSGGLMSSCRPCFGSSIGRPACSTASSPVERFGCRQEPANQRQRMEPESGRDFGEKSCLFQLEDVRSRRSFDCLLLVDVAPGGGSGREPPHLSYGGFAVPWGGSQLAVRHPDDDVVVHVTMQRSGMIERPGVLPYT